MRDNDDNSRQDGRQRKIQRLRRQRIGVVIVVALVLAAAGLALASAISAPDDQADSGSGPEGGAAGTETAATVTDTVTVADISQVSGPGPAIQIEAPTAAMAIPTGGLSGRVICIDPGHAATSDSGTEPIGPGSSQMKVKDPGGTSGVITGVREPVVTLAISLYLKQLLEAEGATVVMTRSGADFSGGNRDRAQIANQAGADLFIRVHADGSTDSSRQGVSTLYPASIPGWTDDIHLASKAAAAAVQSGMATGLGSPDLGTVERRDISGFNWADVPAILVEMGFMSNPDEDVKLNDPAYQQRVAVALLSGIQAYFG